MPAANKPTQPPGELVAERLRRLRRGAAEPYLLACSGGYDSSGLLQLLAGQGFSLVMAHVRHGWRSAAEEEADLRCLREVARRHELPLQLAAARRTADEGSAREERYRLLHDLARQSGAGAVLTAHQRDDQAESVLLALLRGSGLRGLRGIAARRELNGIPLLRPALQLTREQLVAAAVGAGLPISEDSTNRNLRQRRNWLRQRVLPRLREQERQKLIELAGLCRRLCALLEVERAGVGPGRLPQEAAGWPLLLLGAQARVALPAGPGRLLDLPACRRLRAVARREVRAAQLAGGIRAEPAGAGVALLADAGPPSCDVPLDVPGRAALAEGGWLTAAWTARPEDGWQLTAGPIAHLDARPLRPPLHVGCPRPGELFRPLGAAGRRKLKELLREHGVPAARRASWPVVRDAQGVLWLAGIALAERARLHRDSERALVLSWGAAAGA